MTDTNHNTDNNNIGEVLHQAIDSSKTPKAVLVDDAITYGNSAFIALCGDVIGHSFYSIFTANHADQLQWLVSSASTESEKIVLSLNTHRTGGRSILVQYEPLNHSIAILTLHSSYSRQRLADIDELTSLPNRRRANMMLEVAARRLLRHPEFKFCIAYCDIDFFKKINDTHGHEVGDDVLRHIGQVLQAGLRENDWAARWGGEEFIIFLDESDLATGIEPLERMRKTIETAKIPHHPQISTTMSFGIVCSDDGFDLPDAKAVSIATLLGKADTLLYEAKINGRNRIEWDKKDGTIWVKDNIEEAVDNQQIYPVFYPIVDFNGNLVKSRILCCVRHTTAADTIKFLKAADRLLMRGWVDWTLLKSLDFKQLQAAKTPFIFPVSSYICNTNLEEMIAIFRDNPFLQCSLHHHRHFSPDALNALPQANSNIALAEVNISQFPMDVLNTHNVRSIILSNPNPISAETVNFIQEKAQVFAQFEDETTAIRPPTAEEIAQIKAAGFNGYVSGAASEEI